MKVSYVAPNVAGAGNELFAEYAANPTVAVANSRADSARPTSTLALVVNPLTSATAGIVSA